MINNISDKPVTLKWNGKEFVLNPGEAVDTVKVFGSDLEARFMGKFPGAIIRGEGTLQHGTLSAGEPEKVPEPPPAPPVEPAHAASIPDAPKKDKGKKRR